MKNYRRPAWVAFVVCLAMLAAPATAQIGSLTCSSNDRRYRYCRADTQNNVRLAAFEIALRLPLQPGL
jgi:hypothetical protein